jgi:hypothetical protein
MDVFPQTGVTHPGKFVVSLSVHNTGARAGRHSVLLYASREFRSGGVTPEVHRLVGFAAVTLDASASKRVSFEVSTEQFAYYGEEMVAVVESGSYKLFARYAKSQVQTDVYVDTAGNGGGRTRFLSRMSSSYVTPLMMPWLAISACGSLLMMLCFGCGAALTAGYYARAREQSAAAPKAGAGLGYGTLHEEVRAHRHAASGPTHRALSVPWLRPTRTRRAALRRSPPRRGAARSRAGSTRGSAAMSQTRGCPRERRAWRSSKPSSRACATTSRAPSRTLAPARLFPRLGEADRCRTCACASFSTYSPLCLVGPAVVTVVTKVR